MQTRVPEKYLGSNEDATGHGPRLEHAPMLGSGHTATGHLPPSPDICLTG